MSDTLVKASPILLTGTGLPARLSHEALEYRGRRPDVHGRLGCHCVAVFLLPKTTDRSIMLTVMAVAGLMAGLIYGAIPGPQSLAQHQ